VNSPSLLPEEALGACHPERSARNARVAKDLFGWRSVRIVLSYEERICPRATSSSAFRIAAPAAPRIVLWLNATKR
jgi:hypothetical protein